MTATRRDSYPEFGPAWKTIVALERPLLISHANADADAVASIMALFHALTDLGRSPTVAVGDGNIPANLCFIPGADQIVDPACIEIAQMDGIVVLDCADIERLGPVYAEHPDWFEGPLPVVNLDHHITNTGYGQPRIIDADAAATAEILAYMFQSLPVTITPEIATCLLAGIYGDTLALRTPSTSSRTLHVTADLLDAGGNLTIVVDHLFRMQPFSTIRLWGEALARTQMIGGLVWTEVTHEMLKRSGALPSQGEGLVNFISGTEEASVGAIFYEQLDGWRVSLRTGANDIDVAEIAALYGGGGHSRAAGCSLPAGTDVRDQFLADVARRIAESVPAQPRR